MKVWVMDLPLLLVMALSRTSLESRPSPCSILALNLVPGHPDDQGAYRSELAGLFEIVLIVNLICSWADIT